MLAAKANSTVKAKKRIEPTILGVDKCDYLLKVLLVGDVGCGKSSALLRFTEDIFVSGYKPTAGINEKIHTMAVGDDTVKFQIFDTSGQQRYHTITESYYSGVNAVILCVNLNHSNALESLDKWKAEIDSCTNKNTSVIILGMKADEGHVSGSALKTNIQALNKRFKERDFQGLYLCSASYPTDHTYNKKKVISGIAQGMTLREIWVDMLEDIFTLYLIGQKSLKRVEMPEMPVFDYLNNIQNKKIAIDIFKRCLDTYEEHRTGIGAFAGSPFSGAIFSRLLNPVIHNLKHLYNRKIEEKADKIRGTSILRCLDEQKKREKTNKHLALCYSSDGKFNNSDRLPPHGTEFVIVEIYKAMIHPELLEEITKGKDVSFLKASSSGLTG